jgi:hypothetical protein
MTAKGVQGHFRSFLKPAWSWGGGGDCQQPVSGTRFEHATSPKTKQKCYQFHTCIQSDTFTPRYITRYVYDISRFNGMFNMYLNFMACSHGYDIHQFHAMFTIYLIFMAWS